MTSVTIRRYRKDDAAAVGLTYRRAILEGTVAHYDDRQRTAWAGYVRDAEDWQQRLAELDTWVAVANAQPIGFMSLRKDGNLDLAFLQPEWMGRGVGLALYEPLEQFAREQGHKRLDAEASHLARPFFLKRGWQVLAQQDVDCRGVPMTNFLMEKLLP